MPSIMPPGIIPFSSFAKHRNRSARCRLPSWVFALNRLRILPIIASRPSSSSEHSVAPCIHHDGIRCLSIALSISAIAARSASAAAPSPPVSFFKPVDFLVQRRNAQIEPRNFALSAPECAPRRFRRRDRPASSASRPPARSGHPATPVFHSHRACAAETFSSAAASAASASFSSARSSSSVLPSA